MINIKSNIHIIYNYSVAYVCNISKYISHAVLQNKQHISFTLYTLNSLRVSTGYTVTSSWTAISFSLNIPSTWWKKDPIHAYTTQQAILPRFYRERCSPLSPSHLAHRPVTLFCFISTPITVMSKSTAQWGRCREKRQQWEIKKKKHTSSSMLKIYYSWPQKIVTEQQILSQGEEPSYSVWDLSVLISVWQICWTHSSKNWLICFFLYLAKQRLPSINLLVSNFAHLNTLWYPPSVGLHPACKSRW